MKPSNIDELQKIKAALYDNARKDGTIGKIAFVCRELGAPVNSRYGPKYELNVEALRVYVDDYGNYMTVKDAQGLLCSTHNERLFASGDWHLPILALHEEALHKKQAREFTRAQRECVQLETQLRIGA